MGKKPLTVASKALTYAGEPVVDLMAVGAMAIGVPGVLAGILATGAKHEIERAAEKLKEAGRPTHTDQGFEMIWKIAHKASIKPKKMKEQWRALLRAAMDRDFPHEIRMEDVDFLDSLNPADALVIEVLWQYGDLMRKLQGHVKNLGNLINVIGSGSSDIVTVIESGFIDARHVIATYENIHGTRCAIGWEEVAATIQTRSRMIDGGEKDSMAILELHGQLAHGVFRVTLPDNADRHFTKTIGGAELTEAYCVGHLSPQAKRIARLLNKAK